MKHLLLLLIVCCLWSCQNKQESKDISEQSIEKLKMDYDAASTLVELPLNCATQEYPNKLNQVIEDSTDLKQPKTLHPAFYGCFDWHSAVHGHWSMVELLKLHPNLKQADSIKNVLQSHLRKDKYR